MFVTLVHRDKIAEYKKISIIHLHIITIHKHLQDIPLSLHIQKLVFAKHIVFISLVQYTYLVSH